MMLLLTVLVIYTFLIIKIIVLSNGFLVQLKELLLFQMFSPWDLHVDSSENIYVVDYANIDFKFTLSDGEYR